MARQTDGLTDRRQHGCEIFPLPLSLPLPLPLNRMGPRVAAFSTCAPVLGKDRKPARPETATRDRDKRPGPETNHGAPCHLSAGHAIDPPQQGGDEPSGAAGDASVATDATGSISDRLPPRLLSRSQVPVLAAELQLRHSPEAGLFSRSMPCARQNESAATWPRSRHPGCLPRLKTCP
jgi:hypothetical protein